MHRRCWRDLFLPSNRKKGALWNLNPAFKKFLQAYLDKCKKSEPFPWNDPDTDLNFGLWL